MRDIVEIGVGREARRTYRLNEIGIVPTRRTRSSKDVDTTWNIDAYSFSIPFASHPTDALATPEFVIEMGRQGGLGVINAEGLWGRHEDLEAAIASIRQALLGDDEELTDDYDDIFVDGDEEAAVEVLQKLHAQPIDHELLARRIREVRDSGQTVAVRVSPQNARELAPVVIKAGAEILFIQGTVISAEHVSEGGEPLNLKEFIGSLDVPVIAGGVSDYATALHLMRTGAAGVIVGAGENTNDSTLGIGAGMATAIADVAAARRDYLDETGGRYVHVLADDREIQTSAHAVTAIACGADAVILGLPLALADEAGGQGIFWPHVAGHPRFPRGRVEFILEDVLFDETESLTLETVLHGPSYNADGHLNFVGALKRAMAKCGYTDLKKFQRIPLNVTTPFGY